MAEHHKVVSSDHWIDARKKLLIKEKEFTRLRQSSASSTETCPRRPLPSSVFEGPNGKETLAEHFDGRSPLIVYHFIFHPDWAEGCKHCLEARYNERSIPS